MLSIQLAVPAAAFSLILTAVLHLHGNRGPAHTHNHAFQDCAVEGRGAPNFHSMTSSGCLFCFSAMGPRSIPQPEQTTYPSNNPQTLLSFCLRPLEGQPSRLLQRTEQAGVGSARGHALPGNLAANFQAKWKGSVCLTRTASKHGARVNWQKKGLKQLSVSC